VAARDLPASPAPRSTFLPFGNGRSYGDSCHNSAGTLIDSRDDDAVIDFHPAAGTITCEAGITLRAIFARVIPEGFFLPVTPGTAEVTLGGAIANDVHGKNHHRRGTFGAHVETLTLRRSDGEVFACSRHENADLFAATIGGMGLTGLILYARIRLMRVPSPDIRQRTIRFNHIDEYFARIDAVDAGHEYSVAWIDQLATGKCLGRGILIAGDHAEKRLAGSIGRRLTIPFAPPVNLLNRLTLSAFNEAYFRKAPKREAVRTVPWRKFFHPLDSITQWNRLYGPRGLFQHQSLYPAANAPETTARLLECARAHGHASFLTVLKRFGDIPSPGLFSFARPGFTLTLDFANQGAATLRLLDALDEIVVAAGGAVNPYKDARMGPETFAASFPNWRALEIGRDPAMMSDFWARTAIRLSPETRHQPPDSSRSVGFERLSSPSVSASPARNPATKDAAR
jgi:FAD/FMN-containing dehydrogenase